MILQQRLQKQIKRLGLVALILLLVALSGCSLLGTKVVLYPIQPTDFYVLENDDICMTEFYFEKVLGVALEAK